MRVQREGERLRYRVTATPDIAGHQGEVVRDCRDLADTLRVVQAFLAHFETSGPR